MSQFQRRQTEQAPESAPPLESAGVDGIADPEFCVAVAVGPRPEELDRLEDLFASVLAYEPGPGVLVVVDDAPRERHIARRLQEALSPPPTWRIVVVPAPQRDRLRRFTRGKGICTAMLTAFLAVERQTRADVVLKLDTDSLVIGPCSAQLREAFAAQPAVGILGAYTQTPNGCERNWQVHAEHIRLLWRPAFDPLHPITWVRDRFGGRFAPIRKYVRAALGHGYKFGEHCLGGGYAVRRKLLGRMAEQGSLTQPMVWQRVDCPEDVMMGMYARAAGYELANFVRPGETFGVRHTGLPAAPEELVEKGYSVIHAVKNDPYVSEQQIREFFRARRPARAELAAVQS